MVFDIVCHAPIMRLCNSSRKPNLAIRARKPGDKGLHIVASPPLGLALLLNENDVCWEATYECR